MNFDQLKAFYCVTLSGSFTQAAGMLHLSQPAVSQQIQALEHSLGITLFDRSRKKVRLTSEGEILKSYSKQLFDLYDEISTLFEHQQTLKRGKISIGSTRVLGTYFLPRIIGLFNKQYPGVEIDLRMGNSHHVLGITLDGQVDFGFAGKIKIHSRLVNILIHRERLLIVCSADHSLAGEQSITIDKLIKVPFIWREKGTQTREVVTGWFEKNVGKNYPKKSFELENVEAAKRIVEEGYGITIIPESAVQRDISTGLLKALDLKAFDLTVDFYLFHLKGKVISKAAGTFLKMLSEIRLLSHTENLKDMLTKAAF